MTGKIEQLPDPPTSDALSDLTLRRRYTSGRSDVVAEFFSPCLSVSNQYDRAVGFFSSSCYVLVGVDVASFVNRGGQLRLVCCPRLSDIDVAALREGYVARSTGSSLAREIDDALSDPLGQAVTRLLATIVALGAMDIRIAFRLDSPGIYHDKVGIFTDRNGARVTFDGSTNESWLGWSTTGNYEGFHAFTSWADPDRVMDDVDYFDSLWNGREPGLEVIPFPEVALDRLERLVDPEGIDHAQSRVRAALRTREAGLAAGRPILFEHQREVLRDWTARAHRGIVEHATGSGKTITALAAAEHAVDAGQALLIVGPAMLLDQWRREVLKYFHETVHVLVAGGGHVEWREGASLRNFLEPNSRRFVVASLDTAATRDFTQRLRGLHPLCVIVDEVHRAGSPQRRHILEGIDADWRLGLSATWEREGDSDGTAAILSYFERVLQPVYTLADALRDGRLSPYRYVIHTLSLNVHERQEWHRLTARIGRAIGSAKGEVTENAQHLLIQRARLIKTAEAKISIATDILAGAYRQGDAWLVYCDDTAQLRRVRDRLRAEGIRPLEYHRQVVGAEEEAIAEFERSGGIMLAIRCLDEGVDIPRIDHAIVLASSTTKREFIQRRGRILRRADRKYIAEVHDLLVDAEGFQDPADVSFLASEIARAREFASHARDSVAARLLLDRWDRELLGRQQAPDFVNEFEDDEGS